LSRIATKPKSNWRSASFTRIGPEERCLGYSAIVRTCVQASIVPSFHQAIKPEKLQVQSYHRIIIGPDEPPRRCRVVQFDRWRPGNREYPARGSEDFLSLRHHLARSHGS
jgi:hypothetical protein